jgi:hypothetical protein
MAADSWTSRCHAVLIQNRRQLECRPRRGLESARETTHPPAHANGKQTSAPFWGLKPQSVNFPRWVLPRSGKGVGSVIGIGTALAGCPSHRSVRAELPHTALTSDHDDQAARRDRIPVCRYSYAQQSARPGSPALCPARERLFGVLLGQLPSLHRLRRRRQSAFVRPLLRYYGTV